MSDWFRSVRSLVLCAAVALPARAALADDTLPVPAPAAPIAATAELAAAPRPAAPAAFTPDGEVRAMWVVRDSMTTPQKIRNAVALAKKYGFNTLFVQVRGRGDAFYHSQYEPRSEELMSAPADFDPLAVAVAEGHRAGLEVHAWMDTFLVWHKARMPYSSSHVLNRHPEWVVRDRSGRVQHTESNDCEGAFLDPGLPEVRDYLRDVFADVAAHYAVDGVHLDYVRYPAERFSFSKTDMRLFREWLAPQLDTNQIAFADTKAAHNPLAWYYLYPSQWRDWRRSNVSATVRGIAAAMRAAHPGVLVSAAVFPNYNVAYNDKGQSWRDWLHTDLLDAACPMSYNRSTQVVAAQIREAVLACPGKPIIAGVGAWQVPSESAIAKGKAYRALGAAGINFFSYDGMTRDGRTERYLQSLNRGLFASRSAPRNWRRGAAAPSAALVPLVPPTEVPHGNVQP